MSLGVVIKGPEGIVLAADSRVTLTAIPPGGQPLIVNFDNATKLFSFAEPHNHVGIVTYGMAVIGLRTAHSFLPELEPHLPSDRVPIQQYAQLVSEFFMERWSENPPNGYQGPDTYDGPDMTFVVGGYDPGEPYGSVYLFSIPRMPTPEARNPEPTNFGITWGGQLEVASRLLQGFDPALPGLVAQELNLDPAQVATAFERARAGVEFRTPYQILPLQDCIDLATFLLRTTTSAQNLSIGVRGVGGQIEVAIVTRTRGIEYIQQKQLRGER